MVKLFSTSTRAMLLVGFAIGAATSARAQVVPGTGARYDGFGDDFEDESWSWYPQGTKSSREQNKQTNYPLGYSSNSRWMESAKRGRPDVVKRVATPPGGLVGSKGALMLRTLYSGIPGYLTGKQQQDDFLLNANTISLSYSPSMVVRVYLPPFDEWEDRTGSHFGVRAELVAQKTERRRGLFRRTKTKMEPYWPGFFVQFHSKTDGDRSEDSAMLIIRCDHNGQDVSGPALQPGWVTLGMSFTPDGRVHYYARQGVYDLTAADYITSTTPYSLRGQNFGTFFFNVVNQDDGRSWSTPFIIDDPQAYYVGR